MQKEKYQINPNLNAEQLKALKHQGGPLLVVAGAGTGKTTLIIERLAYLILEKEISGEDILIMTFTEKATSEMVERADKILPYGYFDLWINTFHGFCERILRQHAVDIGLNSDFKIISETEQWLLLQKNLDNLALDYYSPLGQPNRFIHDLLKHFSRLKDENISSVEYLSYVEKLEAGSDDKLSVRSKKGAKKIVKELNLETEAEALDVVRLRELAEAYHAYNQLLLDHNYLDFGDLINYTLKLFKERPNILKVYREKFKEIMVDEFQDTNWAQYELVKLLSAPKNNLCVVGDDDQSIYKFRGASISNILQFKDDYPEAKEVILTKNYRSEQEILDRAYEFIQNNNPNRLESRLKIEKKLSSHKTGLGLLKPAVKAINFAVEEEEVAFVAEEIKRLMQEDNEASWQDFVVLVRANEAADKFVKEFVRQGIPNLFYSLKGLYYKPIIIDCLSYFKLLDNYHESRALFRVLNMEAFKVPYQDLVTLTKFAKKKVWSLYETLKQVNAVPNLEAESVKNINFLVDLIEKHSPLIKSEKPSQLFLRFVYDAGILKNLDRDKDQEQFSYLNQFYKKIKKVEEAEPDLRLKDFVFVMDMELEAGETGSLHLEFDDAEVVKIMTVHSAKGLEFKYVFLVNLVDKRFPTIKRGESIPLPEALLKEKVPENKNAHLEEERRLFYVALTRAKDGLYLLSSRDCGLKTEKKPSIFISETGLESLRLERGEEDLRLLKDLKALEEGKLEGEKTILIKELPSYFSFSQLAAYETCPLQYKFAYILNVPTPPDKQVFIYGSLVHNVLYEFLLPLAEGDNRLQTSLFREKKLDEKLLSEERLLSIYKDSWQADGYDSKKDREAYYQRGLDEIKAFRKNLLELGLPRILFLEKKFSFKFGGEVIKGAIDRVDRLPDGTLEVIDYKTGESKKTKSELKFKNRAQLILYKLFLEDYLKIKVSKLSFYYLKDNIKLTLEPDEKEIEKAKAHFLEQMENIKTLNFPPKPEERNCHNCDFSSICESKKV